MHQCNTKCIDNTHFDMAFTVDQDVTVEEFKQRILQVYTITEQSVELLSITEVTEIDQETCMEIMENGTGLNRYGEYIYGKMAPGILRAFGIRIRMTQQTVK